jgi:predicted deacylase
METIALAEFHHSELKPGSKQCRQLCVAESLNGAITVPLLTCRGSHVGPVMLVVAGVHGDEFEGMAAIRHTFAQLDPTRMRGTFVALPVANPWAFDSQTRESPAAVDGKNLARVFPGNDQGSPTDRLAGSLFRFVLRNLTDADLLIDLHSGGLRYRYLPMVGYRHIAGPSLAPSIEAARHFGIDRMWTIPDARGPLNAETARAGIPTIGTEITGQGGCLEDDAALYAGGLLNCLRYLGILEGTPPPRSTANALETCWLHVTLHGIFTPSVDLGNRVETGQLLATVVDSYGEIREELRAEQAGYIWALRTFPSVRPGDIAFMMACV